MTPTRQDVLDAEPGLELDSWAFVHVIGRCKECGWPLSRGGGGCTLGHCSWVGEPNTTPLPLYSVSTEHAARVVERMAHLGYAYNLDVEPGKPAHAHFRRDGETYAADGKTLPEAIAKAALLACLELKGM